MPHRTPKPRKAGPKSPSEPKNRRAGRPDPAGGRPRELPTGLNRQHRGGKRPPRFPGRQGGR